MSSAPTSYTEPRAHELEERHLDAYGADEIPPDAAEVAERFEVSALAAQWRLFSFGLAERPA